MTDIYISRRIEQPKISNFKQATFKKQGTTAWS